MKKRDIIIVVVCVFTTLACIALTFWGNLKNNGVLTTDAFMGVVAALIGVCATVIVGFQIASFVKMTETEKQIKEVQAERDKMRQDKAILQCEIKYVERELSNIAVILASTTNNKGIRIFSRIIAIACSDIVNAPKILLERYKSLRDELKSADCSDIVNPAKFVYKLTDLQIPHQIEHYNEIIKLHIEVIEILEHVNKTQELLKNSQES